jgi:hypothetical protein
MHAIQLRRRPSTAFAGPLIAGLIYVAAWIAGLLIWPASPGPSAAAARVVDDFQAHPTLGEAQFLLVEGVAAIPLAYILVALARSGAHTCATRASRLLVTAGLAACALSVSQAVLGVVLATTLASPAHLGAAGAVFDLINRLDGGKMLLLAATIMAAVPVRRSLGAPRWLVGLDVAGVLALVGSGIGYVAHTGGLSSGTALSLPLLLTWAVTSGATIARARAEADRAAGLSSLRTVAS